MHRPRLRNADRTDLTKYSTSTPPHIRRINQLKRSEAVVRGPPCKPEAIELCSHAQGAGSREYTSSIVDVAFGTMVLKNVAAASSQSGRRNVALMASS